MERVRRKREVLTPNVNKSESSQRFLSFSTSFAKISWTRLERERFSPFALASNFRLRSSVTLKDRV